MRLSYAELRGKKSRMDEQFHIRGRKWSNLIWNVLNSQSCGIELLQDRRLLDTVFVVERMAWHRGISENCSHNLFEADSYCVLVDFDEQPEQDAANALQTMMSDSLIQHVTNDSKYSEYSLEMYVLKS